MLTLLQGNSKQMTHRAVIWDLDGVLVDTGELHYRSWSQALPAFGLSMTRDLFQATFGMNNAGILTVLLGRKPEPELVQRVSDSKEDTFRAAARGHVQPLPGVKDWLARLRAAGFRQAIGSSAPPANIEVLVDELGLREYFDALISGFDLPGKPDPAVFLKAAQALGVSPERCVVVEDSVAGIEAARRAGMTCIAVATTNSPDALGAADLVVARLDALPLDAFERLLSR